MKDQRAIQEQRVAILCAELARSRLIAQAKGLDDRLGAPCIRLSNELDEARFVMHFARLQEGFFSI